jgi:membrane-associated phospholipid phosphatase
VKANKHHLEDVIAGGMLGAANAYFWTEPRQPGKNLGVSLLPLSNGLMIGYRFQL